MPIFGEITEINTINNIQCLIIYYIYISYVLENWHSDLTVVKNKTKNAINIIYTNECM